MFHSYIYLNKSFIYTYLSLQLSDKYDAVKVSLNQNTQIIDYSSPVKVLSHLLSVSVTAADTVDPQTVECLCVRCVYQRD